MCVTDLDLEIAADEEVTSPDPHSIGGRYAGVAWGRAERHDHHDQTAAGPAQAAAGPAQAAAEAARSR